MIRNYNRYNRREPVGSVLLNLMKKSSKNRKLIIYLITLGNCPLNEQDFNGNTPIIIAVKNHDYLLVRLLLQFGADPNIRNTTCYRDNALSWAIFLKEKTISELLISYGGDITIQTQLYGKTLLMWTLSTNCISLFQYLLQDFRVDVSITNNDNKTIYDLCKGSYGYLNILKTNIDQRKNLVKLILDTYLLENKMIFEKYLFVLICEYLFFY